MQTEISDALQKTRALAEQRGWSQVADISASLSEDSGKHFVIAASTEVNSTPLVEWTSGVLPEAEITILELEQLAGNPVPTLGARKMIAVFECGKVIEAAAMDALSTAFYGRPSSSYAIVLCGAERVDTPEELETAQRAAWRVLVPEPKPDWNGQDLLGQNCFLWSQQPPKEFLGERIERDKSALSRWIQVPSTDAATLERDAALYVIELAETQVRQENEANSSFDAQDSALETQQLKSALESVSNTRRHMVRRLDADVSSLERQLTASLQTLEQDMLHNLPAYLQKQAQLNKQADVEQVLNSFVSENVANWQNSTQAMISKRGREITGEVEDLFNNLDWDLVNRVATRQGKTLAYPQAIVDEVIKNSSSRMPVANQIDSGISAEGPASPNFVRKALGAAMIVGVGALLLGGAGIIAGTVTAVVGSRKMHRLDDERRAETYGQAVIREVIGGAIAHVREFSRSALGPTRDAVNNELRDLENLLDRGITLSRNAAEQNEGIVIRHPDLNLLDDLRQQILSGDQSNETAPSLTAL